MDYDDFVLYLLDDQLYVEVFCQKYKTQLVDIFANSEEFPVKGLMYVFDHQQGRFGIEGIKNSLEGKVSKQR